MSHRKRSSIWMHFSLEADSKSKCNICHKIISYKSGSTNNLHRHLKTQHSIVKITEVKREHYSDDEVESACTFASTSGRRCPNAAVTETTASVSTSDRRNINAAVPETIASVSTSGRCYSNAAVPETSYTKATPSAPVTTGPSPTHEQTCLCRDFSFPALTPLKQGEIDEELAKMIVSDFQPFKIVEDRGFENFCYALNPSYVLPCWGALTQKVSHMYETEVASLKTRLSRVSAVCLTTDCWTSQAATSFVSVTCHFVEDFRMSSCLLDCFEFNEQHTGNLAKKLLCVAAEWEVDKKVVCCITDNAPNITEAIQLTGWTHLPCLAHTINLVVRNALKGPQSIINKVREAVEYFRRSTEGAQQLKETQLQMTMDVLRPKQDCVTRWNSTYYMLQSFLINKNPIEYTLAITNAPVQPLSPEEWITLQEICTLLKPFEEVTVELIAESYMTASKVILLVRGLQRATADFQRRATTQPAQDMVNALSSGMSARFYRIESDYILADAAALDPRFKRMAFVDGGTADEAFQRVSAAAASLTISTSKPIQQPVQEEEAGSGDPESIVWSYFHEDVAETTATRNPTTDAVMEVRAYLEEPLLPKNEDPLIWWKIRGPVYPRLSKLVAKKLCVVATSVPAERLFSKVGEIFTQRRSRLKPAKVRSLVFLNENLPKDKKERP